MSTRSRIAMQNEDGSIKSIYCHFDGYPDGVGATLKEHYTDPKKVEELINLGDISSLGTFYDKKLAEKSWNEMDKPENLTVPYTDRGDEYHVRVDKDINEFIKKIGDCCEDYTYLFEKDYDGVYKWKICETPWFREF